MNVALLRRFNSALRRRAIKSGIDQTVVVMTDPEQDEREKAKGKPHHIDKLVGELGASLGDRVFGIRLPPGTDPGSLDRQFLRNLVRSECQKRKLPVSFERQK